MNEIELCLDCGNELEAIYKDGEIIGVGNAWTREFIDLDGQHFFEGFICDSCHYHHIKMKEEKDVKK